MAGRVASPNPLMRNELRHEADLLRPVMWPEKAKVELRNRHVNASPSGVAGHRQKWRSVERYWLASLTCSRRIGSSPARSAMVRATLRMRV